MSASDEAQANPPTTPPTPNPSTQQLATDSHLPTCPICQNDIEPDEQVFQCKTCHQSYHRGELITWINTISDDGQFQTCPTCRADMRWVLDNQQPVAIPAAAVPDLQQNSESTTPPSVEAVEPWLNINGWQLQSGFS